MRATLGIETWAENGNSDRGVITESDNWKQKYKFHRLPSQRVMCDATADLYVNAVFNDKCQ